MLKENKPVSQTSSSHLHITLSEGMIFILLADLQVQKVARFIKAIPIDNVR